jgi:hypothetical protein
LGCYQWLVGSQKNGSLSPQNVGFHIESLLSLHVIAHIYIYNLLEFWNDLGAPLFLENRIWGFTWLGDVFTLLGSQNMSIRSTSSAPVVAPTFLNVEHLFFWGRFVCWEN